MQQPIYKRRPYHPHKDNLDKLEPYFLALSGEVPHGTLKLISTVTGIAEGTLSTWHRVLLLVPDWRPQRDSYKQEGRIFTDDEERELLCRVNVKFLQPKLLFSDVMFREEARLFRNDLVARVEAAVRLRGGSADGSRYRALLEFQASPAFIAGFRERHHMSLRRPSLKRRPTVDVDAMNRFVERVRDILVRFPPERVINIDETHWKLVNNGHLTWAPVGQEEVQCLINDDEKFGVTAIGAVDAAGNKLNLTVIGKGKTPRCLAGYKLPLDVFTVTSESGWTTTAVMCQYLEHLRTEVFPDGPLVVILDTFSAHRSGVTKAKAEELGITLEFIPPGCTDRLQPLDRRVFGVLKSYGRQLWLRHHHATRGAKTTRAEMAASLVEAWGRIDRSVIESAWSIYCREDGEEEQEPGDDPTDSTYRPPLTPEVND